MKYIGVCDEVYLYLGKFVCLDLNEAEEVDAD